MLACNPFAVLLQPAFVMNHWESSQCRAISHGTEGAFELTTDHTAAGVMAIQTIREPVADSHRKSRSNGLIVPPSPVIVQQRPRCRSDSAGPAFTHQLTVVGSFRKSPGMARKRSSRKQTGPDDRRMHRRQLFHWIGEHLDSDRSLNAEERARAYVNVLLDSLQNGLRIKTPRKTDMLGNENEFQVQRPICCFTETSLSEISDHVQEYGHLGLGFPRRFVLKNGGSPVQYCNESQSNPALAAWLRLKKHLDDEHLLQSVGEETADQIRDDFQYLTHFLKRMKAPREPRQRRTPTQKPPRAGSRYPARRFARVFGDTLPYLEEREWRIVLQERGSRHLPRTAIKREDAAVTHWVLPYKPCEDLFTIVVPDHRVMAMVRSSSCVMNLLQDQNRAPVTLLSLTDIGSF